MVDHLQHADQTGTWVLGRWIEDTTPVDRPFVLIQEGAYLDLYEDAQAMLAYDPTDRLFMVPLRGESLRFDEARFFIQSELQ